MGYMAVFYYFFMMGTIGSAPVECYLQDASTKGVGVFKMHLRELHFFLSMTYLWLIKICNKTSDIFS